MEMLNPHCGIDRDAARRRSPDDLQRRLAQHPELGRHRWRARGVRETRRRQGHPRGDPGRPEREEHDRRRRHQGDGEARPEIRGSLHHPAARPLRGRAPFPGTRDRAAARLVPRRRARSRRRLRFPDCRPRRQIRHARSARRHPLGDPCRAAAAADRLGPRPLAGHDGGKYRRADRARLGPGRCGRAGRRARCRGRAYGQGAARMRPGGAARAEGAAAAMGGTAADRIRQS